MILLLWSARTVLPACLLVSHPSFPDRPFPLHWAIFSRLPVRTVSVLSRTACSTSRPSRFRYVESCSRNFPQLVSISSRWISRLSRFVALRVTRFDFPFVLLPSRWAHSVQHSTSVLLDTSCYWRSFLLFKRFILQTVCTILCLGSFLRWVCFG